MPDGGLITPVIKDADSTDIYTMSRSWADLVRAHSLHTGGTWWRLLGCEACWPGCEAGRPVFLKRTGQSGSVPARA